MEKVIIRLSYNILVYFGVMTGNLRQNFGLLWFEYIWIKYLDGNNIIYIQYKLIVNK